MQCITSYSDAKKTSLQCLHCTRTLVQYSVVYYAVHITVVRHITSLCGAPAPNIPNIPPSHSMLFARNHQNHRHRHSCHHHCDIVIIVVIIVFIKATHSLDINWQEKLPQFYCLCLCVCLCHHRQDRKNRPVCASCLTKGRLARQIGANSAPTCRWQRIRGQFCTSIADQTINELLANCQASPRINHNQFKYLTLFVWISQKL